MYPFAVDFRVRYALLGHTYTIQHTIMLLP